MTALKQLVKRHMPPGMRLRVQLLRERLAAPPSENANLHAYQLVRDDSVEPRLTIVLPTIAPELAFGGVLTGLDFFLEIGRRTGVELRVVLDDFAPASDTSVLQKRARAAGLDASAIEVLPRREQTPRISVRATDVFLTFNWWVALNLRALAIEQAKAFAIAVQPYIYLIQDYEPQFYPFSSSHMMARLAFDAKTPFWAVFNTTELQRYCATQGHRPTRSFVFEPQISSSLRPFLASGGTAKQKRILIYGRTNIPRNCFPAICSGLSAWIESDPAHAEWDLVSAGLPHPPVPLTGGRVIRSLGKLSLEDYANLLQSTAVGLSLMASPHPSYPPLEMAHFGLLTLTNQYLHKDLGAVHENILSLPDIAPDTIATGLRDACAAFTADPLKGTKARSHAPWFLRDEQFDCLNEMLPLLEAEVWGRAASPRLETTLP